MTEICRDIHRLFQSLDRYRFPFDEKNIPKNGIYILFEKGEQGHNGDRIVRVGSHTGIDQLRSRLKQHFMNPNKDRSIFRKHIGRAILNRTKDPFIKQWNWDLTPRVAREKYQHLVDFDKQAEIENQVTEFIQKNLSFVVFQMDDKEQRLNLEAKIISTVSWCQECGPTKAWLGLDSPKEKIRESGLWLVNQLYKTPLGKNEFIILRTIV